MLQEQDYSKNLIDLIKNDDTDSVLELIKTSIDIKDMYLDTALQSATEMGNVSIINALIEAGANVESIDEYGQRPIHIAAASGDLDVLSLILNYAYIDSREGNGIGSRGNTALHYAAAEDSPNLTQLLINTGATINIKNNFQETPLHIAVMNNSLRNVINLLKYADDNLIYEENITGSTAIDIATNKDILNLLNRYVKSLSIGVMSSSTMNPDVVGVIGTFIGGARPKHRMLRKTIDELLNNQHTKKKNTNRSKRVGGGQLPPSTPPRHSRQLTPWTPDSNTSKTVSVNSSMLESPDWRMTNDDMTIPVYDDDMTIPVDDDDMTIPVDDDDMTIPVDDDDTNFDDESFYNSANYSYKDKLLYSVNTGNIDMMIEMIGNGVLDAEIYVLLRKSAVERGYMKIVELLDEAYKYIYK